MSRIIESIPVELVDTGAKYDELATKKVTETNPHFYIFSKKQILEATTQKYRDFLKDAGYADIDKCSRLEIAKVILKKENEYVVNINQPNARKLVEEMGYKILTAQLMYNLFIPYIKEEAENDNVDAQNTLEEMINDKLEWLEDLIIDKNKLRVNNEEIKIYLSTEDGKFNRSDLNEFGYPHKLTSNGEFRYWYPRDTKMAVIRDRDSRLGLNCYYGPVDSFDSLGVRLAKFAMERK